MMKFWKIDINCDVGEGLHNEASLFPYISSCNIACGGHAGNPQSMDEVALLARDSHLKVGAHPSYPDQENFGRQSMKLEPNELEASLLEQLNALMDVLGSHSMQLNHIKAHGALYNDLAKDPVLSEIYLDALYKFDRNAMLFVPYGSVIAGIAQKRGFRLSYEAFADRNYLNGTTLLPRNLPNALISEPSRVAEHLIRMVKKHQVKTPTGEQFTMHADTYCIHGDTPSALQILTYLAGELPNHGIYLRK